MQSHKAHSHTGTIQSTPHTKHTVTQAHITQGTVTHAHHHTRHKVTPSHKAQDHTRHTSRLTIRDNLTMCKVMSCARSHMHTSHMHRITHYTSKMYWITRAPITHAHITHAQGYTRHIPITPIALQDRVMWPSHLISRFDGRGTFPCWTPRPPRAGGSGRGRVEGGTRWCRLCHLVLRREGERCLKEGTKWLRLTHTSRSPNPVKPKMEDR